MGDGYWSYLLTDQDTQFQKFLTPTANNTIPAGGIGTSLEDTAMDETIPTLPGHTTAAPASVDVDGASESENSEGQAEELGDGDTDSDESENDWDSESEESEGEVEEYDTYH